MRPRVASLVAFGLAVSACQTDYGNPFAAPVALPPPAAATLLFVGNAHDARRTAPRELFALDDAGGPPTRLTACGAKSPLCEIVEVAPAPDRGRVAVRRRLDSDRDAMLEVDEDDGVYVVDLARGLEGRTIATRGISGVDWSPFDDLLVYSAPGEGGIEDLFSAFANGSEDGNRTRTADIRERRFRFDPGGRVLTYERSVAGQRSEIWLYRNLQIQGKLTGTAEPAGATLPGTHYVIGSDADPDFAPDLSGVVFRRLTGAGEGGRGTWDIMTVGVDGMNLRVIASGPAYRGAPDWGVKGIVFPEIPVGGATGQLVVVEPGGARRVILTQAASAALDSPRWLP
jgi:hypothetical protein